MLAKTLSPSDPAAVIAWCSAEAAQNGRPVLAAELSLTTATALLQSGQLAAAQKLLQARWFGTAVWHS